MPDVIAVIPARGGSKGLPGKNIRYLAGLPLIAHTIKYAQLCPAVTRLVVSTDSEEIAGVAKEYGAEVLMRDPALAQDDTPIWAVLRAVLWELDMQALRYDYLALLEPTSPFREVGDLGRALRWLEADSAADGIIAVALYKFNPIWNGFTLGNGGYLKYIVPAGANAYQRQQVQLVWHHSGELYLWRTLFVRSHEEGWQGGRYLSYPTSELRAVSIDVLEELEWAEGLVKAGMVRLPWLEEGILGKNR